MGFEIINTIKKEKGLTNAQISKLSGVTLSTLDKITSGVNKNPKLDTLQAICKVLGCTINDFVDTPYTQAENKTAPFLSSEAMKIAVDYNGLDRWGKQVVRSVIHDEQERMEDESQFLAEASEPKEPKVINLFINPSAAGPALGETTDLCEPYTLGPDDPQGAAYAIRVQGNSMEPHFPDRSVAFVNHDEMRDGDIGVFCVDGATVIKQWHYDRVLGMTYLFSLNRERKDADLLIPDGSGRMLVWQGRVITKQRFDLPGL